MGFYHIIKGVFCTVLSVLSRLSKKSKANITSIAQSLIKDCTTSFVVLANTPATFTVTNVAANVVLNVGTFINNAANLDNTITIKYYDSAGVQHDSAATLDGIDSSSPVAFVPAITDFFRLASLTTDVAPTGAGNHLEIFEVGNGKTAAPGAAHGIIDLGETVAEQFAIMSRTESGKTTSTYVYDLIACYSAYNGYGTVQITSTAVTDIPGAEAEQSKEFMVPFGERKIPVCGFGKPGTQITVKIKDSLGSGALEFNWKLVDTAE